MRIPDKKITSIQEIIKYIKEDDHIYFIYCPAETIETGDIWEGGRKKENHWEEIYTSKLVMYTTYGLNEKVEQGEIYTSKEV